MRTMIHMGLVMAMAAGCASGGDGAGDGDGAIELDAKADGFDEVRIEDAPLMTLTCDLEDCMVLVHLRGVLRLWDEARPLVLATGDDPAVLAELREHVLSGDALDVREPPAGVTFVELPASDVNYDGPGTWYAVDEVNDEKTVLLFSRDPRVSGPITVGARVVPDLLAAETLESDSNTFWVRRDNPESGWSTDRWKVPVTDLWDFSTAPRITVTRYGNHSRVRESIYYVCGSNCSSWSQAVDTTAEGYSESVVMTSCPTPDESGALYVEVSYAEGYLLDIFVEP